MMFNGSDHERATIASFIVTRKQERYLGFLAKPQHRKKLTARLAHFKDLDPRFVAAIPPSQQGAPDIARILRLKGAPDLCWIISEDRRLDGSTLELSSALAKVVGYGMGTFLSCIPGKLAYFEDEDQRFILQR